MGATTVTVVGRDVELQAARAVFDKVGPAAVVVRGDAGIGKTTVWEAVVSSLSVEGRPLLVARPVEAERHLTLAALSDLVQPVAEQVLSELPGPQRRAVEAALLVRDVPRSEVDPRTLGAALLRTVEIVGRSGGGGVIAIDDFQWVDPASRVVIEFALWRLSAVAGSVLVTLRSDEPSVLAPRIDRRATSVTVDLGPLSLGALQRLLVDRLGVSLPRRQLARVHHVSGGNPLHALEIARALGESIQLGVGDELPMPADLGVLLRARIETVGRSAQRALAATAALADPRADLVEKEGNLKEALDAGIVRLDGGRVCFAHPLFATAAYSRLAPRGRRQLHLRLADAIGDAEQRARHLALGNLGPNESVAEELEGAAEAALARGAPSAAADLFELALERTADEERLSGRLARAAHACWRAGELSTARPLAERALGRLAAGPERAQLLVLLSSLETDDLARAETLALQAWTESQGDVAVEARAAVRIAYVNGWTGSTARALEFAQHAIDRSEQLPDALVAWIVADAGFLQLAINGRVDPELLARGVAAEERAGLGEMREARQTLALALMLEERYDDARSVLERCIEDVAAFGNDLRVVDLLNILSEIEVRAGRPTVGAAVAERAEELRVQLGLDSDRIRGLGNYFRALAAAHLGREEEVRALVRDGLAAAEPSGEWPIQVQLRAVLGFLELSLGNHAAAAEILGPTVQELTARVPGMHPMFVPVLPNLIDALLRIGRLDDARTYIEPLDQRGHELGSAWALSHALSARALIAAAKGDTAASLTLFERALTEHTTGPVERARILLACGAVQRRARKWRLARESLTAALTIFEEAKTPLWADKARAELSRIGGRSSSGGLTPTEARIAQLVADGQSNKEIAAALVVTVRTVETHLTKVYAKLGVRSRTELASRVSR